MCTLDKLNYFQRQSMDEDCFMCILCDFRTCSIEHLDYHAADKHPEILSTKDKKVISTSENTNSPTLSDLDNSDRSSIRMSQTLTDLNNSKDTSVSQTLTDLDNSKDISVSQTLTNLDNSKETGVSQTLTDLDNSKDTSVNQTLTDFDNSKDTSVSQTLTDFDNSKDTSVNQTLTDFGNSKDKSVSQTLTDLDNSKITSVSQTSTLPNIADSNSIEMYLQKNEENTFLFNSTFSFKSSIDDNHTKANLIEAKPCVCRLCSLLSNKEAPNSSDSFGKPDQNEVEQYSTKSSQSLSNQQIPLLSHSKCEVKEEERDCQSCSYNDIDLGRLKFHTFTELSTGAAVCRFSESDQDVKFFCVKETCNFTTIVCTVYVEHLMNCCPSFKTLSGDERQRLKSTLHFVYDYHNKHCLGGNNRFLEYFSSFNNSFASEDDRVQLRKPMENNDISSDTSMSNSLSISDVHSSKSYGNIGRDLENPYTSIQKSIPSFVSKNERVAKQTNVNKHFPVYADDQKANYKQMAKTESFEVNVLSTNKQEPIFIQSNVEYIVSGNTDLENDIAGKLCENTSLISEEMRRNSFVKELEESVNGVNSQTSCFKDEKEDSVNDVQSHTSFKDEEGNVNDVHSHTSFKDEEYNVNGVHSHTSFKDEKEDSVNDVQSHTSFKDEKEDSVNGVHSHTSFKDEEYNVNDVHSHTSFKDEEDNVNDVHSHTSFKDEEDNVNDVHSHTSFKDEEDTVNDVHSHTSFKDEDNVNDVHSHTSFKDEEDIVNDVHSHTSFKDVDDNVNDVQRQQLEQQQISDILSGKLSLKVICKRLNFKHMNSTVQTKRNYRNVQALESNVNDVQKRQVKEMQNFNVSSGKLRLIPKIILKRLNFTCTERTAIRVKSNVKASQDPFARKSSKEVVHYDVENDCSVFDDDDPDYQLERNDGSKCNMFHGNASQRKTSVSFKCYLCGKSYAYINNLTRHMKTHREEKPFRSRVHNKHFSERIDPGEKFLGCSPLNKESNNSNSLISHNSASSYNRKSPFKCHLCDKHFNLLKNFKRHKREHAGESFYKCNTCERRYAKVKNLIRHSRTHREKPFKCDVCHEELTTPRDFVTHIKTHTCEKLFKCFVCDKEFTDAKALMRHKRRRKGKPFNCVMCDRDFATSADIILHKRTHTGEKPFKCSICAKRYSSSNGVVIHKRQHSGERPYKCNICTRGFVNSSNLVKHKRYHAGEKPFKCDVCDKAFTDTSCLKRHKTMHSREKRFRCDMCNQCFFAACQLSRHKKDIHSVEELFTCDICTRNFANMSNLRRHKKQCNYIE